MLYVSFSAMASSMAAITSDSCPLPLASSTRRFTIFALGATPLKVCVKFGPVDCAPFAATMPGDVRAMSVLIGSVFARDEALAEDDAGVRTVLRGEVLLERDAAIDHRDANACSVPAGSSTSGFAFTVCVVMSRKPTVVRFGDT